MASYDVGDRVQNVDIKHPDFDQRGTVTGTVESHWHGTCLVVKTDSGKRAEWYPSQVRSAR